MLKARLYRSGAALSAAGFFALAIVAGSATASAQVTYDVQIPYKLSGLSSALVSPRGIAVAPDGTVYVTDIQTATTGRVISIPPSGTVSGASGGTASLAATVTTIVPSVGGSAVTLDQPNAVAVDSAGHLYIADIGADKIYEVTAPETSPAATLLTYRGTGPTALATDASNNLYVADTANAIYKIAGGVATAIPISPTTLKPVGLAVDSSGNIIFADATNNELYKYTAAGGTTAVYLARPSSGAFHFSAAIARLPIGMGFDPAGNLYVLDSEPGLLWQINSVTPAANYEVPFSSSTTAPGSLAVSNIGNLYISDDSSPKAVAELFYNNNPVNLGNVDAGNSSPVLNANFQFQSTVSGLQQYANVQGDSTGEITASTNGSCNGKVVGICYAQVQASYLAAAPGLRNGAIGFIDSSNNVSAVHIVGTSVAASLALYPGTQKTLSQTTTTLLQPQALAVTGDAQTFFVADLGGYSNPIPAVYAYTASGGFPAGTPATVGSFPSPAGLALDAFGNLYVADYSGYVSKIPPTYNRFTEATTWTSSGTKLTFPAGITLNHPTSVAVDIYNNLYIGDGGPLGIFATASNPGYIVKVPGNGAPATKLSYVVNGSPVIFPDDLITDSFGNLFIADGGDGVTSNGSVDIVSIATNTAAAIDFGNYALNSPGGVAFDAANDLYVVYSFNEQVLVVPVTYAGTVPTADTKGIAPLSGGSGTSGLTYTSFIPSAIVVWPDQNTVSIADIGDQDTAATSQYPTRVLTLRSVNSSVNASSGSGSVTAINVGNTEIKFAAPIIEGFSSSHFSLVGCGTTGTTVEPGLTSACTPTITYDKKGTEPSATIVLNGNRAFDYSPLGNEIAVTTNSVPLSGSGCNGTYDGIFQGNITVSAGQNCIFTNGGGATGTVTENGGKLTLTQSQVGGDVQIMGGTFTLGAGTSIGGNLFIQNLPTGSGQNQICGTTVGGNLQFQNSGVGLEIGSLNPNNCAGNTVGGNLLVQSNTAATQVYNNTVTNDLICSGNTTITGGANKAKAKQGQCATF